MKHFSLRLNTYYRLRIFDYVILAIVFFVGFYLGIGSYALENLHEGIYGEIPREMIEQGKYIIPSLNYVPYIDKPPLFYWLISFSYHLFGVSEFSARLVPAMAGTLSCLAFIFFGSAIRRNREGWIAAVILATSIGFIVAGRAVVIDMLMTTFFILSILSFFQWYQTSQSRYLFLFYLFLSGVTLTSGVLATFIVLCIALIFMISMNTSWTKTLQFFDAKGVLLLLMLTVPWHFAAIKQQSGFAWNYFINAQLYDFLNHKVVHNFRHGYMVILYLFPWSLFLPVLLDKSTTERPLQKLLWVWLLMSFIFNLTLAIPPLAFLLAIKINEFFVQKRSSTLNAIFFTLCVFEVLAFSFLYLGITNSHFRVHLPEKMILSTNYLEIVQVLMNVSICYFIFGIIGCFFIRKKPLFQFLLIAGLSFPLIAFYLVNKQKIEYRHSEIMIADYILKNHKERPIYYYQNYDRLSSLPFYTEKRITMIDNQSRNLTYGMHNSSNKNWFLSLNDFIANKKHEYHYILMPKDKFAEFIHKIPFDYCIVTQSGDALLITNKIDECDGT